MADRDREVSRRLVSRVSPRRGASRPIAQAPPASAGLTSGQQALLRLQRQYGNRYVQRVVALASDLEPDGSAARDVEGAIESSRGSGQSLDRGVQAQIGRALNADFSGVRVHANAQADGLNQSLGARAFTIGQDIYFRRGEYDPGSSNGRELLAHELTHVVQQNPGTVRTKSDDEATRAGSAAPRGAQTKLSVSQPGDQYEQEADRVAAAVMHQEQRGGGGSAEPASVQRQVPEEDEEKKMQPKYRDDEPPRPMHG
ncbi:MAG TPA: DUF4157 domain-containing protein [Candidatus Acidoferrum sp.]|nr:DUF4157 domain-containing protein [Candidatus Acidoferrum sp.]